MPEPRSWTLTEEIFHCAHCRYQERPAAHSYSVRRCTKDRDARDTPITGIPSWCPMLPREGEETIDHA